MGLEFLARIRRSTILLGALAALGVTTYGGLRFGVAFAAGVAWSLANLALLERLVVALTGPSRRAPETLIRAAWSAGGMAALFGVGGALLFTLPPLALAVGFLAPFAVMTLKAASLLLLQSRAWKWMLASPWRAATVVLALFVAAAWLVPNWVDVPQAQEHGTTTQDHGAPAEPHGVATDEATAASPHDTSHAAGGGHAEGGGHGEGGHGSGGGATKFPNIVTYLSALFPHAPWVEFLHHWEIQFFAFLIAGFLCLVAWLATRKPKMVPDGLQNVVEMLVSSLHDFIVGILGEKNGRKYLPFLGTLFVYIWIMNLSGLIPGFEAPTASLNTTFALAITVFLYCQWVGLRSLGIKGYVDHLMGSPRDLTSWLLVPLMLPIHVLGELAKPISLSCRLFGNIFGEDMLLVAFVSLGVTTLAFANLPIGIPFQLPFLFLALLTGTLQALVFTVLSTIYLLLMLPHDDHHEEHGAVQHAH